MAAITVLAFDAEGRPIDLESWLENLHLYQQRVSKDDVSLFEHTSGSLKAPKTPVEPAATIAKDVQKQYRVDCIACTQWMTRDCRHACRPRSPLSQPEGPLSPEFLAENQPPMYLTLYFLTTRLPDTLRAVRDHFLSLEPRYLDLASFEKHLLEAEISARTVAASRGTPSTSFFQGCTPSLLASSVAFAAAVDFLGAEEFGTASASSGRRNMGGRRRGGGGGGGGGGSGRGGNEGGGGSRGGEGGWGGGRGGAGGGGGTGAASGGAASGGAAGGGGGFGGGQQQQQQPGDSRPAASLAVSAASMTPSAASSIYVGMYAMYAAGASAEGDYYSYVPRSVTVEAASVGACEIACTGAVPAEASLSFTLDSGTLRCFFRDCTTVIPLPAPVPVTLADLTGHCVQLHCSPVSGSPLRLPRRSPPPLVRYELVDPRPTQSAPSPTVTAATATTATAATAAPATAATAAATTAPAILRAAQLWLRFGVSLFDLVSGAAPAPPAIADSLTRSQWLTRDAAARLAICNHLPLTECAHFGQHRTAQALYDAVVARYSSPATAALGRLLLPYLFPELSAFATVGDLVSHLRASDTRYRATALAEFLDKNQPPMFITLYFIVTRLPDSLRSVRDHFLSLDPTSLTVDLLEQHLLAAETSAVAIGAACGTPCPPFFEGCPPSPLAPSYASAAAADVSVAEDVGAAFARVAGVVEVAAVVVEVAAGVVVGAAVEVVEAVEVVAAVGLLAGVGALVAVMGAAVGVAVVEAVGLVAVGLALGVSILGVASVSSSSVGVRPRLPSSFTCGWLHTHHHCFSHLDDSWRAKFGDDAEIPRWADLLKSRIVIFDLDFDAILSAMYVLSVSAEGDCYRCVPPDPGIAAAALGASEFGTLPGTAPAEALHTFTLDSGASRCFFRDSTTLTPLPAPIPVKMANPSRGAVVARSSTILPCLAVPTGSLSGLHLPSFSMNLVSTAALQDAMVTTTTLGGQRVSICTCTRTERHLATFTRRPWSRSRLLLVSPPVAPESSMAPPSGSSLPASPSWHALSSSCLWPPQVSASPAALACPALPPLRRGAAARRSSLLLVSPDDCSPADSPHGLRLQLRERFGQDLFVLRLHSDRGGEFSSTLFRDFCHGEGILQSFTLPDSPQQNGIAERRIGLVMEVTRTSMIHAAAPHFLWPFAVRYAAHQLNLWPCVSLPETSPTLRWTGEVGDALVFWVWGSRAFVRDPSADKLSPRAIPCVFLGFVPDASGWQFYHPTSRRVFPSQDVMFDESVPFYRLFPYRSAPSPPPLLFLAPGPTPVDPLPPQGPAPSGLSQVDPLPGTAHVQVAVDSGAARGAASGGEESEGAKTGGSEPGDVEPGGAEPGGAEPEGVEPGGAASEGAEFGGEEPRGAALSGGSAGASPRVSPQHLREWFVRRTRLRSRAFGAGGAGAAGAGGPGVAARAGVTGGTPTTGPGGARTRGTGAAGPGGVEGAGAGAPTEPGAAKAGGTGAGGAGAGGAGVAGVGAVDPGAGGPGDTVRPRPYFVPLLQQVLGVPSSTGLTPPLLCPPPDQSQLPLQPASRLPAPSPYSEQSSGLTERRKPASRPVSPVRTARRVPRSRPPPVPGTHAMALRPSSVPLHVPLPSPPKSSLPEVPDPESDRACAASPTVARLLATAVTDPSFESAAASALVAELLDFAAACRLDYASVLVAESASASPPSVGGECALGTDVLEDRQEDFECLAAVVPRFTSILLAPEGDTDAPDIPTSRSYAEAITGTYDDEVPPPMANIVDGMWIFRVKRPPGSLPAFKARYVARGFSQRQGVDYFHTFSPTLKMTTLRVLLHVAAQRDYELHSLDFSTAFLQGSLHEEIWLRRPPGFTESFTAVTQWSLRRLVYGLRHALREWHDTLRTTLAALGFAPATADPLLFLRTDTSLPPFYVLVYVDDLVFATADNEAPTLVKSELQKRHICTDLGELRSYLGLHITRDRARRTITLTQSHMVHQVLQRFGFQFSSPQPTPLSTSPSLSAPPSDESVEPSGPYPELVGCLMYLMTCTRPDLAYPLSLLARYVAPGRHRKVHWDAAKRVLRYLCSTSGMGLVLGGRGPVVLTGHVDASWELRWLTYLLTDLGEQPRSPPVLYVDNKAMIALCREHRLEHRTKHIAQRYFLAQELQQRGQLRLACVATRANTADVFTKALPPDSSSPAEGGDPAANDTAASHRSPRLEAPPGFLPWSSPPPPSPPLLQPVAVESKGPGAVGSGDSGGAGSAGTGSGGAVSGVVAGPRVCGVDGAAAGGSGGAVSGGAGGTGGGASSGGTLQPLEQRPLFSEHQPSLLPLPGSVLHHLLSLSIASAEPSATGTTPPLLFPLPELSEAQLPPGPPLPTPPRYSPLTDSPTKCREPASRATSLVAHPRHSRVRPPPVPNTHTMALCHSSVSQHVVMPLPPLSSLLEVPRATSLTVTHCLAMLVIDPTFLSASAPALVTELSDLAATCRLNYLASLVSYSACIASVGGELALGCDVLEDRQFELGFLAAAAPIDSYLSTAKQNENPTVLRES
ncbi:unnamed protein product [Closterium sp. NIES-54]